MLYKLVLGPAPILHTNVHENPLKGIGTSQTSKYVFGVFTYLSYQFHTHMNNRRA